MNKVFEKIERISKEIASGKKFFVEFEDGKKFEAIKASEDGRMFQFWNDEVKRWESFSLYEFFKIFNGKITFLAG